MDIILKLYNIDKHCEFHGRTIDIVHEQLELRAELDRIMKQEELKGLQRAKEK